MKRTSLSPAFLAATLLLGMSVKPALAQHFDTVNADSMQRENDLLIHQDIASGRIAAHEGAGRMAAHAPIERAAHHGKRLRKDLSAMPAEASAEETARQNRLLCEQQHGIPAAQWHCRSHAQQR
jgi:hypothetical protein